MDDNYRSQLQVALRLAKSGQPMAAIQALSDLTAAFAGIGAGWNELGVLHYQVNDKISARRCFQRAVNCDGDNARAITNLGACHNDLGNNSAAIRCYEKALEISPRLADAWGNLGKLWNDQREYEFGAYCYQRALNIKRKPVFLRGLGSAYRLSGRYNRAIKLFREAIEQDPNDGFSHTALAALLFYAEDYTSALEEYEWRWKLSDMAEHHRKYSLLFANPARRGDDLSNKTVLIHTEQGYGDNLLFCRYIPLLKKRAKRVIMWCWPGLVDLFDANFDLDFITGNPDELPPFDTSIPLLSLPYHLDPTLNHKRGDQAYLNANAYSGRSIKQDPGKLNIGIVWGCDHNGFDYRYKKVALEILAPIFGVSGTRFFSLQLAPDRNDLKSFQHRDKIIDLAPTLINFKATADVISQLDLVISVDTAVAHLAAAMGKPTWVLLKKNPDWRWHGYDDKPVWYPKARLFCQYPLNSWESVVNRVREALKSLTENN